MQYAGALHNAIASDKPRSYLTQLYATFEFEQYCLARAFICLQSLIIDVDEQLDAYLECDIDIGLQSDSESDLNDRTNNLDLHTRNDVHGWLKCSSILTYE